MALDFSWTDRVDDVDDVLAADVNAMAAAIIETQTKLGATSYGSLDDVATRLAGVISAAGKLSLSDGTTLTISSGAVTSTKNYHAIETEAAAASDDLDTINGGTTNGQVLIVRPINASHNVVLKHGTGNIICKNEDDIILDFTSDIAILIYDTNLTKWLGFGVSSSAVGGSGSSGRLAKWDTTNTIIDSTIVDSIEGGIVTLDGTLTGNKTLTIGDDGLISPANATKLQARSLASTAPSDGQSVIWDNGNTTWKPGGADAIKLQGRALASTAPSDGQGVVWDDANSTWKPGNPTAVGANAESISISDGRLTLQSGEPIPTTDQKNKQTLYYTPYIGNKISLFDGTDWSVVAFTEKSIDISGTSAVPYDVFGYLSGGTLALEILAWTNLSTRATALAKQDGVLIKTGYATRKYLGTICCFWAGYCEDCSQYNTTYGNAMHLVWNMYNRVPRAHSYTNVTEHTYNSTTARKFNNNDYAQIEIMAGLPSTIQLMITGRGKGTSNGPFRLQTEISNTTIQAPYITCGAGWNMLSEVSASGSKEVSIGYKYIPLLEACYVAETMTFEFANLSVIWWS